jgi:hypothetical protein
MKEYYSLLYLQDGASEDEVRNAYKKLAKKFHPDKNEGSNDFIEEFRLIQDAYEKLIKHFEKEKSKINFEHNYTKVNHKETETPQSSNTTTVDFEDKFRFYFKKYKWLTGFIILVCFLILKKALMPEILNKVVKTETQNTSNSQSPYSEWLKEQRPVINSDVSCDKSVKFGEIEICLPIIDGMIECYSNPIVKTKVDEFKSEGNSILALYLNDNTYNEVDKLDEITFDDYFKVYAIDKLKGIKIGQPELNELADLNEKNYIRKNWADIKKDFEKNHNYISIGRPILIESYSPNISIRSSEFLMKVQVSGNEYISIMTMNMIQIKERLIWLSYYKKYEGEKSIIDAKSKNDYIVLQFLDENK